MGLVTPSLFFFQKIENVSIIYESNTIKIGNKLNKFIMIFKIILIMKASDIDISD